MVPLRRLLGRRIASDAAVARGAQGLCFAAAPAVLALSASASARLAASAGKVLIGLLAGGGVALGLVILGVVLPLAAARDGA